MTLSDWTNQTFRAADRAVEADTAALGRRNKRVEELLRAATAVLSRIGREERSDRVNGGTDGGHAGEDVKGREMRRDHLGSKPIWKPNDLIEDDFGTVHAAQFAMQRTAAVARNTREMR